MAKNIAVGIDIGTYQIKIVVAESIKEEGKTSYKIIGTGFAESKGLHHGYIINSGDTSQSLKLAIAEAEKNSNIKIKRAFLSIGGIGVGSLVSHGSIMIAQAGSEITEIDVKNVLSVAENEIPSNNSINKKIIHTIPISYKIDGRIVLGQPIGMKGGKFEVKALFITCLEHHLEDLIAVVEDLGVEVINIMASPLAGSIVILNKTQKIAGCVLANIGSETVSVVVFENNQPISLEVFPIGGTDITNDIALGLKIPLEEAENLKINTNKEIDYPRKKLDEIILARLSDIFDLIESYLKKLGRSGLLPAGIILTGGSSGVSTTEDLARAILKLPSKLGSLDFITNSQNCQIKDSSWSVAYGLCVWGLSSGEEFSFGGPADSSIRGPKGLIKKLLIWFKQFLP
ncbi:MAG: cell division protein FtsA [Candidatus Taylorbacteria bacterium RIFOXYD2_FULL_36_9]|uniref:Cell division protein FtsA n=1 Tax=Candidatus Taylorbacteria bacterium RIFOXYD2_FULL_36_9 TaxID=1802338 RepID=A0A1G2PFX1_9BACT|nr:MAG: cell division protein FtsA [Candidatus Taylorbacteria bacterium RIFOXYD2_FULL_36_9]